MEQYQTSRSLMTLSVAFFQPTSRLFRLAVAFVALMVAAPALAQTTGTIKVTVLDSVETEVPNVTVTLSGPQGSQVRTTGISGTAAFLDLVPGVYDIHAEHEKIGSASITDILVKIGTTSTHVLTLNEIEVITVSKERAVDVSSTSRKTVLTRDFLQKVPAGRGYQDAIGQVSGVAQGPTQGGNPNIGGAASNENTYMLDGANITDPVTGTFSTNFNFDAIQQIEVLLGGYMPEYGVSLGGVVNLVTKSGSNNLEFLSSVFYQNGDWRPRMDDRISPDGYTLTPTGFESSYQNFEVSAYVAGPIIRDKAFFILSYAMNRSLISLSGTPQRRDFEAHQIYGKITVQPSTEHRFTVGVQLDPAIIDNTVQGSPWIKASSQARQSQGGVVVNGKWQWYISPNVNLDTTVVFQKSYIEAGSVPCSHDRTRDVHQCRPGELSGTVDWETPGRIGIAGAYDSVNNVNYTFDDRFRLNLSTQLKAVAIKDPFGGNHDLKFGIGGSQLVWDRINGYNGNLVYYDTNRVIFDPTTFTNYYWLETSGQQSQRSTGSQFNFFLQDSWKPVPNLTINYGTRFDNSVMRNAEGEAVLSAAMWGPRLFASWDPWSDQKTKIATGWGRFNSSGRLGVASAVSSSGLGTKLFLGEYFSDASGTGFLGNTNLNYSYNPTRNFTTANDKLRNPYTDEFILILEREIVDSFSIGSNMSGKFTRNLYEYDETNIVYNEEGDSIIGGRYGNVNINRARVRTPKLAKRDVFQWTLEAKKVQARRWYAKVAYTFTQAFGSSSRALSGSFANDPQTQYNYGQLFTNQNHVVQAQGFWDIDLDPWTPTIGMTFVGASGIPLDRLYYSNAQGGYGARIRPRQDYIHLPTFWELNLKYTQKIDLRKGQLILSLEAQNITNNRAGGNIGGQIYSANRYVYFSRQRPFRLQFGLRYKF